ncbi:hypothetical protein BTS2_3354 [Bacillus sp. TS-2]|nr:hypothetical protein BTS2_3354 [Bacillus sp. TS-2]
MSEKTFNDISPIEGVYSDYIYLKDNTLISMIKVKGVNFDLLSEYQQETLYDEYGAFLAQNVHYKPQTVSMNIPIKMSEYLRKWKLQYIKSVQDSNVNDNLKQLRASYLNEYQMAETNLQMAVKAHFIVLMEPVKKPTLESLQESELRLSQKTEEIKSAIHHVLDSFDSEQEILNASQMLSVLHQFFDYKSSVYATS